MRHNMQGVELWITIAYTAICLICIPLIVVRSRRERRLAARLLSELLETAGAQRIQIKQRTFRTGPIPRESHVLAFYFHVLFRDRRGVDRECFSVVRRAGFLGYRGPMVAAIVNTDGTELEMENQDS